MLLDELVLRFEMLVETTMRQSRSCHNFAQAGRGDTVLGEFGRRGGHDPGSGFSCFLARFPHK